VACLVGKDELVASTFWELPLKAGTTSLAGRHMHLYWIMQSSTTVIQNPLNICAAIHAPFT
jgi:hypothetical protein